MNCRAISFVVFVFLLSAIAAAQPPAPAKLGVVDSYNFADEKAGITKFIVANKSLVEEFKPLQNELNGISTRLQTLSKEVENLRKLPVVDPKAIAAKMEEGEKLQRDLKNKSEDAKDKYSRREKQVMSPVMEAIGKGLQEYAKQKGYTLIFDLAKDQTGFLIAIGDQSVDVTKDFIAFYNAKP